MKSKIYGFFIAFFFLIGSSLFSQDLTPSQPHPMHKKLPVEIECPLDTLMIDISLPYFGLWKNYHVTANGLTLMGGAFQLLACLFLYRSRVIAISRNSRDDLTTFEEIGPNKLYALLAGLLWVFGYYFDAVDGSYARFHGSVSLYGDILDHAKDWICTSLLILVIKKSYPWRLFDTFFCFSTIFMVCLFMGAQEQFMSTFKGSQVSWMLSPISSAFKLFNISPEFALKHGLRWFGTANINLLVGIYLIILPFRVPSRKVVCNK